MREGQFIILTGRFCSVFYRPLRNLVCGAENAAGNDRFLLELLELVNTFKERTNNIIGGRVPNAPPPFPCSSVGAAVRWGAGSCTAEQDHGRHRGAGRQLWTQTYRGKHLYVLFTDSAVEAVYLYITLLPSSKALSALQSQTFTHWLHYTTLYIF